MMIKTKSLHRGGLGARLAGWGLRLGAAAIAVAAVATTAGQASAADLPGKGVTVTPCTSTSIEGLFKEVIVMRGLEKLGYTVNMPRTLTVPAEHQATATGDCTYSFDHWVPLHDSFMEKIKDDAVVIGPTVSGAAQGYLIDKKTADQNGITKLEQFKDPKIAKLFDTNGNGKANLCCTNPGWGAEKVINYELDAIGLRDTIDHDQGEYTAMMADVIARFRRGEPVFFYTWTPHWLLGELKPGVDTVWLEVDAKYCVPEQPCGASKTGFPVNDISIVANKEFLAKNPAAKAFLEAVKIPIGDLSAENVLMRNGEDKEADVLKHAADWIAKNQSTFDAWVAAGMAAK
ncbi:MAG: glycine betaine/L-proline ABC transporter substrate-binding protein ProX [Dongiaceae bacterium]